MENEICLSAMERTQQQRHAIVWICLALAAITLTAYWPVHANDFVNYDDNLYVTENAHVLHGLNWPDGKWAFTTGHTGYSHPLAWLTHQLDYQLYGPWAGGHHLTNLAIHIANALLLFFLFWRTTRDLWPSAFIAAIFAVHPLHVESVAWISERKDVLSGLFFMLTLHAYGAYAAKPHPLRYQTALFFFALGLLSKPMLVTLPCVLLLFDYWPLRRMTLGTQSPDSRDTRTLGWLIVEKIPFALMAATWSVITFIIQKEAGGVVEAEKIGIGSRSANALVSYAAYLWKTFWPHDLAVFYPYRSALPWSLVLVSAIALVLISALCLAKRKSSPYLIVGWLWYLGMLAPVIGVIQVGAQARADRYTYLPQIGLCFALGWGIADLTKSWPYRRQAIAVTTIIALAILMVGTWHQTKVWRNSESLWTHALVVTSNNERAHNQLCDTLLRQGRIDEAISQAKKALEIRPDGLDAHNNLGIALSRKGEPDEALVHFQRVLEKKPDRPKLHYNVAVALLEKGDVDQAIAHFQRELQIQPEFAPAHNNLGLALSRKKSVAEALVHLKKALEIEPNRPQMNYNLATVLLQQGRVDEAIAYFQKELQIQPNYTEALNDLGIAFSQKGRISDAIVQWQKTLAVQPDNLNAQCNLAWIFATHPEASIRDGSKAVDLATRALQLSNGRSPRIFRLLAAAYAENGQFTDAIEAAQRGLELASRQGESALAATLESNIALYRTNVPLRDTTTSSR